MIDEQRLVRTLVAEQVKVLAYIQSIVRLPDMADDIYQDVCALAVEKRAEIADEGHLRNWLRTAARLQSMNAVRKRRAELQVLDATALDAIDLTWREQDGADMSAHSESLRRCLALLSANHRELVAKRFTQDYDYARLAAECRRPVGSLYVTFSRIYTFLGKCIAERLAAEMGGGRG